MSLERALHRIGEGALLRREPGGIADKIGLPRIAGQGTECQATDGQCDKDFHGSPPFVRIASVAEDIMINTLILSIQDIYPAQFYVAVHRVVCCYGTATVTLRVSSMRRLASISFLAVLYCSLCFGVAQADDSRCQTDGKADPTKEDKVCDQVTAPNGGIISKVCNKSGSCIVAGSAQNPGESKENIPDSGSQDTQKAAQDQAFKDAMSGTSNAPATSKSTALDAAKAAAGVPSGGTAAPSVSTPAPTPSVVQNPNYTQPPQMGAPARSTTQTLVDMASSRVGVSGTAGINTLSNSGFNGAASPFIGNQSLLVGNALRDISYTMPPAASPLMNAQRTAAAYGAAYTSSLTNGTQNGLTQGNLTGFGPDSSAQNPTGGCGWACNDPRFTDPTASAAYFKSLVREAQANGDPNWSINSNGDIQYTSYSPQETAQLRSATQELTSWGDRMINTWTPTGGYDTGGGRSDYTAPAPAATRAAPAPGVSTGASGNGGVVCPPGSPCTSIVTGASDASLQSKLQNLSPEQMAAYNGAIEGCKGSTACMTAVRQKFAAQSQLNSSVNSIGESFGNSIGKTVSGAAGAVTRAWEATVSGIQDGWNSAFGGQEGSVRVAENSSDQTTLNDGGLPYQLTATSPDAQAQMADRSGLPLDPQSSGSLMGNNSLFSPEAESGLQRAEMGKAQEKVASQYGNDGSSNNISWRDLYTNDDGRVVKGQGTQNFNTDSTFATRPPTDGSDSGYGKIYQVCYDTCTYAVKADAGPYVNGRDIYLNARVAADTGFTEGGKGVDKVDIYDTHIRATDYRSAQEIVARLNSGEVDPAQYATNGQFIGPSQQNTSQTFADVARREQNTYNAAFTRTSDYAPLVSTADSASGRSRGFDAPLDIDVSRPSGQAESVQLSSLDGRQDISAVPPQSLHTQGGFTGTSLTALTDLPGTSASPFNLAGDTVASVTTMPTYAAVPPVETLTATPPTSLATLSESAPAFDTVSPVGAPSDSVVAQDDVEFNEQYFNMSGRRTDSDPGGDTSALDVANPRQTALGPQPVGGVGQAVPDAMPQYANREEQAAYTRRGSDSGYRADVPTASRWAFYAPNPLGAPGSDNFYYPSPTPQLGGGPLAQSGSWTQMPANVPSPFISQTEGSAFPRAISLTTPGVQYEATLNAPETNFQRTGSLQPPLATPDTVLGSPANTAYAPTGSPDPATIPVVDQSAADKELADFQIQQEAKTQGEGAPDEPKLATADESPSFTDKLNKYFDDVKQKIADTVSGFGINIVGEQSPTADASGIGSAAPSAQDTPALGDTRGLNPDAPASDAEGADSSGPASAPKVDRPLNQTNPNETAGIKGAPGTQGGVDSGERALKTGEQYEENLKKSGLPVGSMAQDNSGNPGTPDNTTASPKSGATNPDGSSKAPPGGPGNLGGGGGLGGRGGTGGGSSAGSFLGALNSALGLLKSAMGQGGGQGQGGASAPAPTQPVQVNQQNPLATPVPSTQFAQQKPPTPAPKVSVVANPNPVQPGAASTISWQATWADAQSTSTTRECAVVDVAGKPLVESAGVASSVQTPALTRAAYFFVGCKQSDGKMGSEKVLVTVQGDSQPPIAPPANLSEALSSGTTGDPAADLSAALSGSSGSGSTAPAANNNDQQQSVNVACDPNSSRYFDCLTQKMQFVDKLY